VSNWVAQTDHIFLLIRPAVRPLKVVSETHDHGAMGLTDQGNKHYMGTH
jgi:hypothetical protein